MLIQPEMGRLLARAKIEEAAARTASASALRADALDRQCEAVTVRALGRLHAGAPIRAITRGAVSHWSSVRGNAPRTN